MSFKKIRQECTKLVDELTLPRPFSARALCKILSEQRQRPIYLLEMKKSPEGVSGSWVATEKADYIYFESQTTRLHQEHIILHEVGHMLYPHSGAQVLDEESRRLLLPSLDPKMIDRVFARTSYTTLEEQQAELVASLVLERVSRWVPEPIRIVQPEAAAFVKRLESVIENLSGK